MGRHWVVTAVAHRWTDHLPYGTLLVNVSGSFLIGILGAAITSPGKVNLGPSAQDFLLVGLMGGYTTFSSFSLQTLNLAMAGRWGYAFLYAFLSLFLCLAGVAFGFGLFRWFNPTA